MVIHALSLIFSLLSLAGRKEFLRVMMTPVSSRGFCVFVFISQTQHMVFTCPLHQHLIDDLEHSTAVTAASFNSQLTYTTSIMPAQNMLPHLVHKATAWGRAPPSMHREGRRFLVLRATDCPRNEACLRTHKTWLGTCDNTRPCLYY